MNKIYQVIYNRRRNAFVVVSEISGAGSTGNGGSATEACSTTKSVVLTLSTCAFAFTGLFLSTDIFAQQLTICDGAGAGAGTAYLSDGTSTPATCQGTLGTNSGVVITTTPTGTINAANPGMLFNVGNGAVDLYTSGLSINGGPLSMTSDKITDLGAGTALTDAVNVSQLNSLSTSTSIRLDETTSNVSSLSTGISTNTSNIASLSTGVSTNTSNIASLSTGIGTNTSNIVSLSTGIGTNTSNINSLSTNVASISTGLGQLTSLSVSLSGVTALSTSLAPLTTASAAAAANGATIGATTIGSANSNGTVQTRGATGTTINNVNVATCSIANGIDASANGLCAQASQDGATALGSHAQAVDTNTTAVGFRALASQAGSVAIGNDAQATGDPTVAIGQSSRATGNQTVAVGASAQATANNSTAIGSNARAIADNSVAIGANSLANQANTLSVGSAGSERRIINVAPGINATDAVNVSQLNAVQNQIADVQRVAYSGIAMSMALTGAVMPSLEAGEKGLGAGIGSYQGYTALALQFKAVNKTGNSAWGAGISTTGRNTGLTAGYGFKWK